MKVFGGKLKDSDSEIMILSTDDSKIRVIHVTGSLRRLSDVSVDLVRSSLSLPLFGTGDCALAGSITLKLHLLFLKMSRLLLRSGKGLTLGEVQSHREALRTGIANTSGLPALPTELLFEIISHFPTVPLPIGSHELHKVYPAQFLERHRILRVLSQMCRSLRSIFLPYVWEKIEVWASSRLPYDAPSAAARRSHGKLVNKELATELVSQLEIVTVRDPTLAQRVK
jgi:hypothetical protein